MNAPDPRRVARLLPGVALALTLGGPAASTLAADIAVPGQFPTVTIAVNAAADGDVLVLAPGTYFEIVDLGGKDISVRSQNPDDPATVAATVIDAFGLGSCLTIAGGQGPDVLIAGITLRGGAGPASVSGRGGGAYVNGASPTFRNVRFVDNSATETSGGDGGGVFVANSSARFIGCVFIGNIASELGGGMYVRNDTDVLVEDCLFEDNVALLGGGLAAFEATLTVRTSDFLGNGSDELCEDGGGMFVQLSDVTIDAGRFEGNMVADDGSALMVRGDGDVVMTNCIVRGNQAGSNAAVYVWDGGTLEVRHCTVVDNIGAGVSGLIAQTGEGGSMAVRNSIVWANVGPTPVGSGVVVTNSTVQDGHSGPGANVISVDPLLDADLRLMAGSPAIDSANSLVLLGPDPRDFDGNPRAVDDPEMSSIIGVPVYGLTADMGAFEYRPAMPSPTCPTDVTGDGAIDFADLLAVLASFGDFCP